MAIPTSTTVNAGHWVEAQHLAHIMVEFFDAQVSGHPAIRNTPELAARADAILEALGDLYQHIGRARP